MNPNWFGTICAGGALAAFYFTYRVAIKADKRRRTLLAAVALVLALPSASFAFSYAHVLPEPACRCSSGFDPEIPFPAVAGVRLGAEGHFIAVLSREGERFQIGDPLEGPELLSRGELLERYEFTGFYMAVSKTEQKGQ